RFPEDIRCRNPVRRYADGYHPDCSRKQETGRLIGIRVTRFGVSILLAVLALLVSTVVFAGRAKTDLVFIGKADRVTGEIKQLDRGMLNLSTNNIGTLNIEWEDVDSLNSVYQFRVEDRFGHKYFGSLFMTRAGPLEVIQGGQTATVAAMDVVSITPL